MQTNALRTLFMSFLVFFGVSQAEAALAFQERILEVQSRCPRLNCPSEQVWVVTLPSSEQKLLAKEARASMKDQIELIVDSSWPEVISQSSLKSLNRLRIDKFEKLVVDGKHAGYRVSYSDKAWNLESCSYDPQVPGSIQNCKTGRISESVFVDLNLQDPFVDEQARAAFRPDPRVRRSK